MEPVIDTQPRPPAAQLAPPGLASSDAPPAGLAPRKLNIEFTGSGSEYFRIWIVNLLLIVVTLGLYLPFAKARRIRYFHANTLVDGQALGFHGDPWKMFRGFILLVVLMAAYGLAGRFSPLAALLAFIALCVVWPALWRASMQFRLANTSWRGLRMAFDGGLKEAYLSVAPLYVPLVAFVGLSLFAQQPAGGADTPDPAAAAAFAREGLMLLGAMAVVALMTPWFLASTKRYQHNGYRIAGQQARITLPTGRVYALCGKGVLLGLAGCVVLLALAFVAGTAGGIFKREPGMPAWGGLVVIAVVLLSYLLVFMMVVPYFAAAIQNLVWNATRSQSVTFDSQLEFRALFWLTVKNWLLVALTLSLYRPFAAIHTARLRLQAVSLTVSDDVAQWSARDRSGMQDATGDVAGDFFGIDMGL